MTSRHPAIPDKSTNGRSLPLAIRVLRPIFAGLSAVSPGLAGRIATDLFRTPRRFPQPKRETNWLADAERSTVRISSKASPDSKTNSEFQTWSWGEGPTVLLVHGWEGRGGQLGAFAQPLVDAGFRAVTFDAPGHGRSAERRSSLPQFTHAIESMAETFGPFHGIVCHSFGTPTTAFALRRGLSAERLAFVSSPTDVQYYPRWFGEMIGLSRAGQEALIRTIERRFEIQWGEVRRTPVDAADDTPLLVVHDRDDRDVSFDNGRTLATIWPNARLFATEGLGHRRILRDPEVVTEVVDFMASPSKSLRRPVECAKEESRNSRAVA